VIGDDCEICAGVVVCGEVTIGDGVRVGGNSWIKPLVTIGAGAILGGGSVVTKDVPAHEVWAGNPARYMKKAWTHPDVRGLAGRKKVAPQYAMTDEEWEIATAEVHRLKQEAEQHWQTSSV
jgi:acetyltransferase-like isoleucine patch superfamily enzyme